MDYENDIIIDEQSLDVEWLNQPRLAIKYSKHWALCFKKHQQIVEELKLIKAELTAEVLTNPEETTGFQKPTGAMIDAYIRTHDRHIEAKERLIEAHYELNVADIAKKEMTTTRKAALQNLVELHGQSYFAGPTVPRDLSYEVRQRESQKKADNKVARRMRKK